MRKLNLHGAGRDSERMRSCGFKQRRQSGQEHHLLAAFQQLAPAHSAAHCNASKCRAVKIDNTYHVSAMRHRNACSALGLQGSVPRRFSVLTRAGIGKQSHQQRGGQDTEQGQMRLRVASMHIRAVVQACAWRRPWLRQIRNLTHEFNSLGFHRHSKKFYVPKIPVWIP